MALSQVSSRPVGAGGAEGAGDATMAPPVNPISPRAANYAHHIITYSPGFSDLPTALSSITFALEMQTQPCRLDINKIWSF